MDSILIIGGTGGTGKELINQALEQAYKVTALVRNPMRLKIQHEILKIVKGDVMDPGTLNEAFKNQDAVLSSLGHKRFIIKSNILSEGTRHIIEAMRRNNVQRFICISSLGVNNSRFKLGLYYTLFAIPFILYFYFRDKEKQEKIIMQSKLKWTTIRPGQLINGKKRMKYKHGENTGHYILTKFISRADVAHFMLKVLKENRYVHTTPGIHY